MAGGRGERFWPASRLARPKHLLPIVGEKPMLAQTIDRLEGLVPPERVLIITNAQQVEAVREVCPALPHENIIAEPIGRDTAAAVGLAMTLVRARDPECPFVMLPADAAIMDAEGFRRALRGAFAAALAEPVIVTIGIPPNHPATGYGYIEQGDTWQDFEQLTARRVKQFREKPDAETAQQYLDSGSYVWNAGIFAFSVPTIAACFASYAPSLNEALEEIGREIAQGHEIAATLGRLYPALEKISVDYAIMEPASKAGKIVCLPAPFDWDDVGEWPAVARHVPHDALNNAIKGTGLVHEGKGNLLVAEGEHRIALLGCDDLMVIHTEDATLVCPKDRAQDIKALVKSLPDKDAWKDLL